jgi:hypothetical protein
MTNLFSQPRGILPNLRWKATLIGSRKYMRKKPTRAILQGQPRGVFDLLQGTSRAGQNPYDWLYEVCCDRDYSTGSTLWTISVRFSD